MFFRMGNNRIYVDGVSASIIFISHKPWPVPFYLLSHYLESDKEETAGPRDGVDFRGPASQPHMYPHWHWSKCLQNRLIFVPLSYCSGKIQRKKSTKCR